MVNKLSRRALVRGAVGVALVTAATPLLGQEKPGATESGLDVGVDALEKQLAHPLDPAVKKLLRAALQNLETEMADRRKSNLPENSEPCFVFVPTGGAKV